MSKKVYEIVTERIVAKLEEGVVPWRQPWQGGGPRNLVSKKQYRGVNAVLLGCQGYESPFWLTYNQARAAGGHVRRGEHGTPLIFWTTYKKEVSDKDTGERYEKTIPVLRYYTSWNVAQCDGITPPTIEKREVVPIDECEHVVRGMPERPRIDHEGDRACYRPLEDRVLMPTRTSFDRPELYYSVLFHELVHSTGHEKRLNREGIAQHDRFGSKRYSREELIAEIGSAFLCAHAGIERHTLDLNASYIDNWRGTINKDTRLVVEAASHAQKAADHILGTPGPTPDGP